MRRGAAILVLGFVASCAPPGPARLLAEEAAGYGSSHRVPFDGIPCLVLKGTARERGRAHGFLGAREILGMLDRLLPLVAALAGEDWVEEFRGETARFDWPPAALEEMRGLLEGIREAVPDPAARKVAALGREPGLDDAKLLTALGDLIGAGCSSFAAWGASSADGAMIAGRNGDFRTFPVKIDFCLILSVPSEPGRRATLNVSAFGSIASGTVLNDAGLFLALHDSNARVVRHGRGWTPRALAIQEAAETCATIDEAAASFRSRRPAVGANLVAVSPEDAAILEWEDHGFEEGLSVRRAGTGETVLLCTNHYRTRRVPLGCDRYQTLLEKVPSARVDEARARELLDAVARNGEMVTWLSVVARPAARELAVAFSPSTGVSATRGTWVRVPGSVLRERKSPAGLYNQSRTR